MRTCTYCGKEYPEDATVCAVDGEQLTALSPDPPAVTGAPPPLTQRQQNFLRALIWVLRALWVLELTLAVWALASGEAINLLHPYNLTLLGFTFAAAILIWLSARWAKLLAAIFGILAQLMLGLQMLAMISILNDFADENGKDTHRFEFGPFEGEGIWGQIMVLTLPMLLLVGSSILFHWTVGRRSVAV